MNTTHRKNATHSKAATHSPRIRQGYAAITLLGLCLIASPAMAAALKGYNVTPGTATTSGVSSGGYMTVQTHVALSSKFKTGVAVFAGGPYNCAQGSAASALGACMTATSASAINTSTQVNTTKSRSSAGSIDNLSNLTNTKVYLFSGTKDTTVKQGVMDALKVYYQTLLPSANIIYNNSTAAGHSWVSPYGAESCASQQNTYINNCNIDPQQTFLTHFYGTLNAKSTPTTLGGQFIEFDQKEFFANGNPASYSVANTGWMYVPQSCGTGAACKLHVAFHGCEQYYGKIGNAFVKKAGLNEWADTNNIIVVYPQTIASQSAPLNPKGCWDWWGYTNASYDVKSGVQMSMVAKIVDRITSGSSTGAPPSPTGLTVSGTSASSVTLAWNASSGASSYNVYRGSTKVGSPSTTAYTDNGLAASTTYSYRVSAVNASGESPQSGTVSATTGSGSGTCYTASNYAHVLAARAYACGAYACAYGSNQNMGLNNTLVTKTLKKTGTNYYVIGTC